MNNDTLRSVFRQGLRPRGGNGAPFRALVLSALPIVRAGVVNLLRFEFGDAVRISFAEWLDWDKALAAAGREVDLVVAHPDGDATEEVLSRLALAAPGSAVVLVLPEAGLRARPGPLRPELLQIAFGAELAAWRLVLRTAVSRAQRDRIGAPGAGITGGEIRLQRRARRLPLRSEAMPLTQRQLEIFQMLESGLSNKKIAERLELTVGTVKLHVAAVLHALNARSRVELLLRRVGAPARRRVPFLDE